ncbi:MAG: HAD domain-containing protein [Lachnospiraceae bacterium]|nr:HAD domain-containing protein [Lachnospiraceae bacterium]
MKIPSFRKKKQNSKNKVIFLDIDGVLNHDNAKEDMDSPCLLELQKIVEATGAKLVLTSSWKYYFFQEENNPSKVYIEKRLSDFHMELYDIAPDLGNGKRAEEIALWLDQHKDFTSYVILDDCFFPGFKKMKHHLCMTDWNQGGLTKKHSEKAIQILNGPHH